MYYEYRKIKNKAIGGLVIVDRHIEYHRKIFEPLTGDEKQARTDIVDLDWLNIKRNELLSKLNDLNEMIADFKDREAQIPPEPTSRTKKPTGDIPT